jgi:hypothetical protein
MDFMDIPRVSTVLVKARAALTNIPCIAVAILSMDRQVVGMLEAAGEAMDIK